MPPSLPEEQREGEGTKARAPKSAIRTSERAKELGRLSGEARRAKAAARRLGSAVGGSSALDDGQEGVLVPIDVVDVVRTLNRAAKGGDVQAARELRAWLNEHPTVDKDVRLELQPRVIRNRLLARLLLELQEQEEGQAVPSDVGQGEGHTGIAAEGRGEATPAKPGSPAVGEPEAPQSPPHSGNEGTTDERPSGD